MNIIFVCKHNVFRSRVAEAVFKKHYKGKKHKVISRGPIPLDFVFKNTIRSIKAIGYNVAGKPKPLNYHEMQKQDLIVIVADDVPKKLFANYKRDGKKIIVWKIKDTSQSDGKSVQKIARQIEKKVKLLIEKLEK